MIDITILTVNIENFERIQETGLTCMKMTWKQQGGMTIE